MRGDPPGASDARVAYGCLAVAVPMVVAAAVAFVVLAWNVNLPR